ncbi:SigE family RNA polymerase sigma factor [Actinospica durhamensis]|uniref:SigE family RNA polymerase sigma factor n=1 Tax=Actinospica durhamensis TaxID=1508375 RepID=A0A941IPJ0_9ACTN|nr:SigE family RNA polymerase sigma factor [Actinospica durhamensis]MBR7832003.1 SigE family RNA polymerase sigma factor [Actinospica durhamensis]
MDEDFADFARERQQQLYRTAYLLSGNRDRAQDLVQSTLVALLRSWNRVREAANPDAYARTVLIRVFLTERRRLRREAEVQALALSRAPSDTSAQDGSADLRLTILQALRALPPKPRAMVILRYWEDLTVEQTAAVLGCSEGNVKSQCSRSLEKLRTLLGDRFAELATH